MWLLQYGMKLCVPFCNSHVLAMIRVMPSKIFKKEYIQRYHLAYWVCQQTGYFSGQWFQFLTNFDPSLLLWLDNHGGLPLAFGFFFCFRNHLTVSSDDWLLLSILYQRKNKQKSNQDYKTKKQLKQQNQNTNNNNNNNNKKKQNRICNSYPILPLYY